MKYRILSDYDQHNVETWMNDLGKFGWQLTRFELIYNPTYGTRYTAVMEKNEIENKPV